MNVECPACKARGTIEGEKVPPEGRSIVCPRCKARFVVRPERTVTEIIQQRERMHCPKCGCEQPLAESCAVCGIDIRKHVRAAELQRESERLQSIQLRSELRQVDTWYRGLFNFRSTLLIARVLLLLVGLALFMTCTFRGPQRQKFNHQAENEAAVRKAAEGPSRPRP